MAPRALFSPATTRRSSRPSSTSTLAVASPDSPTAAILPLPRVSPCRRLRWKITWVASSRLRAPLAQAAATSPTLWPITAAGWKPCAASTRVTATCRANSAGCAISVRT
ncbi:hypothetical protein D3C78_896990 [compost metagenome]